MKSQIRYNKPITFALLQTYMALMDGEEINYEYFNELTGFSLTSYKTVIQMLKEMIEDLHLRTNLVRLETTVETPKTKYQVYRYTLSSIIDYSFQLPEDLEEEKRINYLPTIVYLKLKKKQYVSTATLSTYIPNFTRKTLFVLLNKLKEMIDADIYKDELQSYVLDEE